MKVIIYSLLILLFVILVALGTVVFINKIQYVPQAIANTSTLSTDVASLRLIHKQLPRVLRKGRTSRTKVTKTARGSSYLPT